MPDSTGPDVTPATLADGVVLMEQLIAAGGTATWPAYTAGGGEMISLVAPAPAPKAR
jgi:hypothetical protein